MDDEHKSPSNVPVESKETESVSNAPSENATAQLKNNHDVICCGAENNGDLRPLSSKEEISTDQVDALSKSMKSVDLAAKISGDKGSILLPVMF